MSDIECKLYAGNAEVIGAVASCHASYAALDNCCFSCVVSLMHGPDRIETALIVLRLSKRLSMMMGNQVNEKLLADTHPGFGILLSNADDANHLTAAAEEAWMSCFGWLPQSDPAELQSLCAVPQAALASLQAV